MSDQPAGGACSRGVLDKAARHWMPFGHGYARRQCTFNVEHHAWRTHNGEVAPARQPSRANTRTPAAFDRPLLYLATRSARRHTSKNVLGRLHGWSAAGRRGMFGSGKCCVWTTGRRLLSDIIFYLSSKHEQGKPRQAHHTYKSMTRVTLAECTQRQPVPEVSRLSAAPRHEHGVSMQNAAGPSRKGASGEGHKTGRQVNSEPLGTLSGGTSYELGRSCSSLCGESAMSCPVTSRHMVGEGKKKEPSRSMRVISGTAPVAICPRSTAAALLPRGRGPPRKIHSRM